MSKDIDMAPVRTAIGDVALNLVHDAGCGATICFTERTGGFSKAPFASLNMLAACGDDPATVERNWRLVFDALGAADLYESVVTPRQVHSDTVVIVEDAHSVPSVVHEGCDAVVCTVQDCAVMLSFADCAPVVITNDEGFAVVHSGWKGTLASIAGKAAKALADATGKDPSLSRAWIGPHISAEVYEVSSELAECFAERFGPSVIQGTCNLDLSACITASLAEAGLRVDSIYDTGLCTASNTDRFFSHRAENGRTGRHSAIAFMRGSTVLGKG